MTVEEKLISLTEKLQSRTERGEVQWEESTEETQFLTSFPQYSVSIRSTPGSDGWGTRKDGYTLSVMDANGKLLEGLAALEGQEHFPVLTTLYQLARRQALGVNNALDNILSSLE